MGSSATLKLLGARHRQLGIKPRHYRTMAQALIWTLEQSLETSFRRDTKEAWNDAPEAPHARAGRLGVLFRGGGP